MRDVRRHEDFSIRGRLGVAFDRILIYGTGGGAYGNFHTSYTDGFFFDSFNTGHFGWTVAAASNTRSITIGRRASNTGTQTMATSTTFRSHRMRAIRSLITFGTTGCRQASRTSSANRRRQHRPSLQNTNKLASKIGIFNSTPAHYAGVFYWPYRPTAPAR